MLKKTNSKSNKQLVINLDTLKTTAQFGLVALGTALVIKGVQNYQTKTTSLSPLDQPTTSASGRTKQADINVLAAQVLPKEGVSLPIRWGDLGKRMLEDGVIDEAKLKAVFPEGLPPEGEKILKTQVNKPIVLNQENSRFLLDMFWAFGLANKNSILSEGPMMDPKYGKDASRFASTGGWTLAKTPGPNYYNKFDYLKLTPKQQALVEKVAKNIYRPCCGNSTYFPDCNHGMAMLGLLELMAANGVTEDQMYKVALKVNSFWFPQTYMDLATYFKEQGTDWKDVNPKLVLSANHSSALGYTETRKKIKSLPTPPSGGGSCGT